MIAVLTIATFVGAAYTGLVINVNTARWNNPATRHRRSKKTSCRRDVTLVSFSPIEHRFAYYYDAPIPELDWPTRLSDLPPNVDYFCFMRSPGRHGRKSRRRPRPHLDKNPRHAAVRLGRSDVAQRRAKPATTSEPSSSAASSAPCAPKSPTPRARNSQPPNVRQRRTE